MIGLLVAALGGAAVGLERQWSGHAKGPGARFAGIRTFTLLGATGGLAGWLWTMDVTWPGVILLAGAVALTVAGYVAASGHDVDGTTEVAALIVLGAGVLAGIGNLRVASGLIAIEILLLVEKTQLHALVERIDDVELRAGVRFGVMALVVLPLLPEGPYGPLGGIKPRELWALVLFVSGLSFVGHVAQRLFGAARGYLISGAAGGLVSSTDVTLTFARMSRSKAATTARHLAVGAVAANAVAYVRVLAIAAALDARLVRPLVLYLAAPAAIAAIGAAIGAKKSGRAGGDSTPQARNPLQLGTALQIAAIFQVVLMASAFVNERWGQSGVVPTALVLGLTDVDALTLSMAKAVGGGLALAVGARAIAAGVLVNTGVKLAIALFYGSGTFRVIVAGALAVMAAAAGAALFLLS